MSVISAVVDLATNGVSTQAESLRELIGDNAPRIISDCWLADLPPFPYVILAELGTSVVNNARAGGRVNRVEQTTVAFAVNAQDRATVEAVIQAIDDLYLTKPAGDLTDATFTHMGTRFSNRFSFMDFETGVWRGQIELLFEIIKS